jgi:hypothetical protein
LRNSHKQTHSGGTGAEKLLISTRVSNSPHFENDTIISSPSHAIHIQGVSGEIVNILGGGGMDYSE